MLRIRRAPIALLALLFVHPALARKPKAEPEGPTEDEVVAQARSVYDDLAGNSNPFVRVVAFEGRLALEADEDLQKAVQQGLTDAHWPIQAKAMGLALSAKGKKAKALKVDATAALDKLLQSGDEDERTRGYEVLEANFKGKDRLARIQTAAKLGSPEARSAARGKLLAEGGKTAWKVIEAGLAEPEGEPEHKEALKALETWSDPIALKWAQKSLQAAEPIGGLARGVLIRVEGRQTKRLTKTLLKAYDKASGEFEDRVRLAVVLAGRGQIAKVQRTCLAGLKYRVAPVRALAWQCLGASRDLALLGKVRERILITEAEPESEAAFGWLRDWAKAKGEPKVYEVLQAGARSDRRPVRMRAMQVLTELRHRPSIALFESSMSEGQTEVRLAAAKGMAAVAEPGDEKRIGEFLRKEPDPAVKLALIEGLAHIGTPETIDVLQFVITAPQTEIKQAAVNALAATGQPKAATLLALLKRDPNVDVRFTAWQQLLRLQGKSAEREFASAISWLTPGQVETLAKDPKLAADILELIARKGSDEQRVFALEGLVARGDAAATRLLGLSEHPEADTASAALRALANLRKQASVPTYRKRIESMDGPVRAAAFAALGAYAPRGVLDVAISGMGDKDPLARAEAARAAVALVRREEPKE